MDLVRKGEIVNELPLPFNQGKSSRRVTDAPIPVVLDRVILRGPANDIAMMACDQSRHPADNIGH